jgi:hypothetical protein
MMLHTNFIEHSFHALGSIGSIRYKHPEPMLPSGALLED